MLLERVRASAPEAVRRAAPLAGLAGMVAAGKNPPVPATDDGADGGAASASPVGPSADDAALANRIAPVLGDEEATDDVPGSTPEPAVAPQAGPTAPAGAPRWKWAVWAAVVLVVAVLSRLALRPGASRPA